MRKAIQLLDEVKESIINAYQIKTGQSRAKLSHLMDSETWMYAWKANEPASVTRCFYRGSQPDGDGVGLSYAENRCRLSDEPGRWLPYPNPKPEKVLSTISVYQRAEAEDRLWRTRYL
jgi:hypothetical protein